MFKLSGRFFAVVLLALTATFGLSPKASAQQKAPINVVASFSILANIVEQVGGPYVKVTSLVAADADAHAFNPTPADAKTLASADLVIVNGLGFEGWLDRLIKSSGFKGKPVVASQGVKAIRTKSEGHGHSHGHSHGHNHGNLDPHAWQDLANGRIYALNIQNALVAALPAHADEIRARTQAYVAELDALNQKIKSEFAAIPASDRRVLTSHDAFAYFSQAYGVQFLAVQGFTTDQEPSAKHVATLIRKIRADKVRALFLENMSDPRLLEQIASETSVRIGGELYSDALSAPGTVADTYLKMMSTNAQTILMALQQ